MGEIIENSAYGGKGGKMSRGPHILIAVKPRQAHRPKGREKKYG
jgi:hypothetical protein